MAYCGKCKFITSAAIYISCEWSYHSRTRSRLHVISDFGGRPNYERENFTRKSNFRRRRRVRVRNFPAWD